MTCVSHRRLWFRPTRHARLHRLDIGWHEIQIFAENEDVLRRGTRHARQPMSQLNTPEASFHHPSRTLLGHSNILTCSSNHSHNSLLSTGSLLQGSSNLVKGSKCNGRGVIYDILRGQTFVCYSIWTPRYPSPCQPTVA